MKKRPTLIMPDSLRDELKESLGPVITDEELPNHVKDHLIAVVGDVAAAHVVRAGYRPKLIIVDFRTRRGDKEALAPEIRLIGKKSVKVVNPPARITPELWEAVERAYEMEGPVRIEVDGEEDLASLVCIVTAPMGSLVIYGVPGKGMTVVTVDSRTKAWSQKALDRMKRA